MGREVRRRRQAAGLAAEQVGVDAAGARELRVRALLRHAPRVHHHDAVRRAHRRQPATLAWLETMRPIAGHAAGLVAGISGHIVSHTLLGPVSNAPTGDRPLAPHRHSRSHYNMPWRDDHTTVSRDCAMRGHEALTGEACVQAAPVRDDEHGAAGRAHRAVQRGLHLRLALHVQRARGLPPPMH